MQLVKRVLNNITAIGNKGIDIHNHKALDNIFISYNTDYDYQEQEDIFPYLSELEIRECLNTKNIECIIYILKDKFSKCQDEETRNKFINYFCNLIFYTDLYPKSVVLLQSAGFELDI